jgi:hypothetical protein
MNHPNLQPPSNVFLIYFYVTKVVQILYVTYHEQNSMTCLLKDILNLWGTLNVKFRIYMRQMTIFRKGIRKLSNLFCITLLLSNFLMYTY